MTSSRVDLFDERPERRYVSWGGVEKPDRRHPASIAEAPRTPPRACPRTTPVDWATTERRITRAVTDQRVLFFGDSHVAGVGDPTGLGWVGRVVSASFAAGLPLTAYNLGVRGETSVQVAARWRQETRARLAPGADTRIVVSFGANDTTIEDGAQRVEEDRSRAALDEILERAQAIELAALVVGPAPVDDSEQNRRIQSLSDAFDEICAERGVSFLGVVEPLLTSDVWSEQVASGDGAHPGAAGYEALAELVLSGGWLDWLRSGSATKQTVTGTPWSHRDRLVYRHSRSLHGRR